MFNYFILLNLLVIILAKTSNYQIKKFYWIKYVMSDDKLKNCYKTSFKPIKKFFTQKISKIKNDLIDINAQYYSLDENDRYLLENMFNLLIN